MTVEEKRRRILRWLGERGDGTVNEFVRQHGLYVNSWAPTFTYLKRDGLIEATGLFRETQYGSPANVWRVTDKELP